MSLMICSTSHRQRGVRLLLLVAGAVLACVLLYFLRAFFSLFLHFMVYSVETVVYSWDRNQAALVDRPILRLDWFWIALMWSCMCCFSRFSPRITLCG